MPRAVDGTKHAFRRKKVLKQARGYFGTRKSNYTIAKDAVRKSLKYAYRDRKAKKRNFRSLWIVRISAFVRERGLTYSQFIQALMLHKVTLNRKSLAYLAAHNEEDLDFILQSVGLLKSA